MAQGSWRVSLASGMSMEKLQLMSGENTELGGNPTSLTSVTSVFPSKVTAKCLHYN